MNTTNAFFLNFLTLKDKIRLLTVSRTTANLLNNVPHVFQHVSVIRRRSSTDTDHITDINLRNIWARAGDQLRTIHLQGLSNVTEFGFIMLQSQPHLTELSIIDCDFKAIDRLKVRTMDRESTCAGQQDFESWSDESWCPSCSLSCSECTCLTVAEHDAGAIGPIEREFIDRVYMRSLRTEMNLNMYNSTLTDSDKVWTVAAVPCTATIIIANFFAFPHPKLKKICLKGCRGLTIEHLSILEGHGINNFDVYECHSCRQVTDDNCSCPYKCCQPDTVAVCFDCWDGKICRCDKLACEIAVEVQNWDVCAKCASVACEDCNIDWRDCSRCNQKVCDECVNDLSGFYNSNMSNSMCTDCDRWFCCDTDENEEDFTVEQCTNCEEDYCSQCRESSAMCCGPNCMAITCGNCEPSTIFKCCDECGEFYCKDKKTCSGAIERERECHCSVTRKRKR